MGQTPRDKMMRLRAHYPDIVRFNGFKLDKLQSVFTQLGDIGDFGIIQYDEDLLNYVATALLLKIGKFESYIFMNAYELIDIYLGNKEEFRCISDIDCRTAIIYLGYSEFENKRQADVLEQLFEFQRVEKKRCYILFKGSSMETRYSSVVSLFKGYGFPVIKLTGTDAGSSCDDEL